MEVQARRDEVRRCAVSRCVEGVARKLEVGQTSHGRLGRDLGLDTCERGADAEVNVGAEGDGP